MVLNGGESWSLTRETVWEADKLCAPAAQLGRENGHNIVADGEPVNARPDFNHLACNFEPWGVGFVCSLGMELDLGLAMTTLPDLELFISD